jgi:type IV secretion system protein VirD4
MTFGTTRPKAIGGWSPSAGGYHRPGWDRPAWDPAWDNLLLQSVVIALLAGAIVLATGHLSALVFDGGWPRYEAAEAPGIVWRVAADPGDPGRAWASVNTGASPPGPLAWWATFIVVVGVGAVPVAVARRRQRVRHTDEAVWAGVWRTRHLRLRSRSAGRLVVGRAGGARVAVEARHSLLVFGPTQSGKTTGLAIPAILEWRGPVVATSTKGDLIDHTIGWRTRLGTVHIYEPAAATRYAASGWTPLATADTWHGASRAAWDLAMAGKAAVGGSMSLADFWFNSAAKSLAPYLLAAANTGRSIADVARWVDTEERDHVLAVVRKLQPDAALAHQATFRREDRARSSLFQVMQQILGAYLDPTVARSAERDDIKPAALLTGRPDTLYLTSPYLDQARLRPLFATVVRQVIAAVHHHVASTGRPLDPPLLVVLDEAANIAPVEDLATVASTSAAMGVQLVTVFQDLAQVRLRYREAAGTVVNNHRATLFLPGIKDLDTLDLASRLIGDSETIRDSITHGVDGRRSATASPQWRRLLPAEAARTLADRHGVLVYGNLPPLQVRLRPWYRNYRLRHRARIQPPNAADDAPTAPEPEPAAPQPRRPRDPRTAASRPPKAPEPIVSPSVPDVPPAPNVTILDLARARLRSHSGESQR